MALLALGPSTSSPASALLHPSRWDAAATALSAAFLRLAGAPPSPSLAVALAAGIVALRTPACCADAGQRVHRCPTCQEPMRALAAALPTCQRGRTVLACRISRQPIDEDNPPLVAPSGHVYSRQGVRMLTVRASGHTHIYAPLQG
jgi:macrophage erythroblast attacher